MGGINSMATRVTWDSISLRNILKADPFGESLEIHSKDGMKWEPFIDRATFFGEIYVEVAGKNIQTTDGSRNNKRTVDERKWMEELSTSGNSLIIFIDGYAGCGKSIFVQNLLKAQLNNLNYDSDYYNYDIGAYYDNKNAHRIIYAIRECLLKQMGLSIINGDLEIIRKFEELLAQEEIKFIDSGRDIFYSFSYTDAYKDAVHELVESRNLGDFNASMKKQIEDLSCEQLLALDCVFRLAKYIVTGDLKNSTLYVCYDNLDSIENFDELSIFHNTLIALRRNLDDYIEHTDENYKNVLSPHFVIISTYRKITLSRVESAIFSERCEDYGEDNCYIQHIDASHFYQYSELVESRKKYFNKFVKTRKISAKRIKDKLSSAASILSMDLIQKRYAGIWNNNYRTCSDIFDILFSLHEDDIKKCITLLDMHEDGYDEKGASYYGASAAFLNLICRIFKKRDIWGPNHLALVPLGLVQGESISQLTSLSRLILTYMSNVTDEERNPMPVSTQQLFKEFSDLYSADEICRCIANMLIRDTTGTWRRPVFYHRNAINAGTILASLKEQWNHYLRGDNFNYTELLLCDCGYAHINRVVSEFEFFSVRLNGLDQKPLYLMNSLQDICNVITQVQQVVGECCQNMTTFKTIYMGKKHIQGTEDYIELPIHPRTKRLNPQLHTERIIFSHIAYLDHCRRYFIGRQSIKFEQAKKVSEPFHIGIKKYLKLYKDYIEPINPTRRNVYDELQQQLSVVQNANNMEDLLQCIEMFTN